MLQCVCLCLCVFFLACESQQYYSRAGCPTLLQLIRPQCSLVYRSNPLCSRFHSSAFPPPSLFLSFSFSVLGLEETPTAFSHISVAAARRRRRCCCCFFFNIVILARPPSPGWIGPRGLLQFILAGRRFRTSCRSLGLWTLVTVELGFAFLFFEGSLKTMFCGLTSSAKSFSRFSFFTVYIQPRRETKMEALSFRNTFGRSVSIW